jgi:hypothetical protein
VQEKANAYNKGKLKENNFLNVKHPPTEIPIYEELFIVHKEQQNTQIVVF